MHQHATLEDTVYFWFAANDTSGSGNDGATPVYDVRLGGAAADAIPTLSGSAVLLSHANYPPGCHEVAIAATAANGFAAGNTYAVFCTLLVDSQNPSGFVGSFTLGPIVANVTQWNGTAVHAPDTAGYPVVTIKDGTGQGEINLDSGIANTNIKAINDNIAAANYLKLACDNYTAIRGLTGTALPNAVADAAGGLPISDAGGLDMDAIESHLTDLKGTGFVKDTDSMVDLAHIGADGDTLETLSDQLDAIGNAGGGARTVTVTVDDGADPLESASVRFTKGAATYVLQTDASGNATFNLDDGTYTVAISRVGYTYAGSSQVVDGDETPTYSMTALTISAPSAASLCTVQFRVKVSNTAVSGAVCKAKLLGINQASDGVILSNAELSDTTDAEGIAELQLVQEGGIVKGSGRYKISVEIAGQPVANTETTIPSQSTVLFEDLL